MGAYIADVGMVVGDGLLHVLQRSVGFPLPVAVALLPEVEIRDDLFEGSTWEEGLKEGRRQEGQGEREGVSVHPVAAALLPVVPLCVRGREGGDGGRGLPESS